MTTTNKIIIALLLLFTGLLFFMVWYDNEFSMKPVQTFEINEPSLNDKVLIATQGSPFKKEVVDGITTAFDQKPVYFKVIDVKELEKIQEKDWNVLVIIHTWEWYQPPKAVAAFMDKEQDLKKIVLLATSGNGSYKMKGVDAISGASIVPDAPIYVTKIVDRIQGILEQKSATSF